MNDSSENDNDILNSTWLRKELCVPVLQLKYMFYKTSLMADLLLWKNLVCRYLPKILWGLFDFVASLLIFPSGLSTWHTYTQVVIKMWFWCGTKDLCDMQTHVGPFVAALELCNSVIRGKFKTSKTWKSWKSCISKITNSWFVQINVICISVQKKSVLNKSFCVW